MKILIISHAFPPTNAIASLRPYSWAKYWSKAGHEITVLTTKKVPHVSDLRLDCSGFEVIPIDYLKSYPILDRRYQREPIGNTNNTSKQSRSGLILNRIRKFFFKTGTFTRDCRLPNIYQLWTKPAVDQIIISGIKWDIAIATFAPFAAFQIADRLKNAGVVKKIVLDFRDLWTDSHLFKGIFPFQMLEAKMERRLCKNADMLTVVSEPLAKVLRLKYDKVFTIMNAFDPEDLKQISSNKYFNNNKINIVYTGSIYPGHRDPTPLFEAMYQLKKEGRSLDPICLYFFGSNVNDVRYLIEKYNLTGHVFYSDLVAREDSLRIQRDADILLFLEDNKAITDGIMTGKLFEYLFSGTPIWCVGKKWLPSRIIKENNLGYVFENEVLKIKENLIRLLVNGSPQKIDQNEIIDRLNEYTRKYQADRMLSQMMKL